MGVIDFIKKQTRKILVILGLSTAVATLSGCGESYDEKTTNKAIEIIENATNHVDGHKYESLENDIKACEELIEQVDNLSDDKQGESSAIANETLKALDAVATIVSSSKGLERSGEGIIEQGQKWYAEVSSNSAWKNLRDIVNTVNEWPEDEFGEFATTMEGLYYETGETIGWDVEKLESFLNGKQQQTTQQQATQGQTTNENTQTQEDNSSSSNIIDDAANAVGRFVGGAANKGKEVVDKVKEGYENVTDGMGDLNQGLVEGLPLEDQAAYYDTEAEIQQRKMDEAELKKAEAERKAAEARGSLENTSFQMSGTSGFRNSMKVEDETLKTGANKPVTPQVLEQIDELIAPGDDEARL